MGEPAHAVTADRGETGQSRHEVRDRRFGFGEQRAPLQPVLSVVAEVPEQLRELPTALARHARRVIAHEQVFRLARQFEQRLPVHRRAVGDDRRQISAADIQACGVQLSISHARYDACFAQVAFVLGAERHDRELMDPLPVQIPVGPLHVAEALGAEPQVQRPGERPLHGAGRCEILAAGISARLDDRPLDCCLR